MKIGIYGGAFNPIHYGHLRTAEEIFELLGLDKVLFVPSGRPPFDKPDLEDANHRYNMVKIALKGNQHFKLSDIEMRRRGRAYSVDTIKRLEKEFKGDELFFIMGIDAFLDLPKWKEPERLINLTNLVIMSRPHFKFVDLIYSPYLKYPSKMALKRLDIGAIPILSVPIAEGRKAFLSRVTEINISASYIRRSIMDGKSIRYLLPEVVESYIISHRLYKNMER